MWKRSFVKTKRTRKSTKKKRYLRNAKIKIRSATRGKIFSRIETIRVFFFFFRRRTLRANSPFPIDVSVLVRATILCARLFVLVLWTESFQEFENCVKLLSIYVVASVYIFSRTASLSSVQRQRNSQCRDIQCGNYSRDF